MNAYIGRQPIFDRFNKVAGYQLLYRDGGSQDSAKIRDGDTATQEVLSQAVTVFGLPHLTNKLPAYINFTKNLLMTDFVLKADPRDVVIMVMEDVAVDDALTDKLRDLRKAGYKLALQGYSGQNKFRSITGLFHIIGVDFSRLNSIQRKDIAWNFAGPGLELLATKVESYNDFNSAMKMGYSLFQGYYFEKPVCLTKELPPLSESTYGRLVTELMKDEPNMRVCRAMVTNDIILSYMLLRKVQKSSAYRGRTVMNLQQALMVMRAEELWRWVVVILLRQTNITSSDELPRNAYIRGLFIERLANHSALKFNARNGFILGVFSLLDQTMGIPMEDLLEGFPLEPAMRSALLAGDSLFDEDDNSNPFSAFLRYVMLYEMASELDLPDIQLRMNENEIYNLYMSCIAETDKAFEQAEG